MVAENSTSGTGAGAPGAGELFNSALESFMHGEIDHALTCLRAGFFENLYIAPTLIGEQFYPQEIWYEDEDSEPAAAADYVTRFGQLWRDTDASLIFLAEVWNDPSVRRELKSYISLSKAILQAPDETARSEFLSERRWFLDQRRIRGTQNEILGRLHRGHFGRPIAKPKFQAIQLAAHDPAATVEFYRQLFQVEPTRTSRQARGYAEFELPGVRLVIHGHDRLAPDDPYELGPPPRSLGWGVVFLLQVREFDRYYGNAERAGIAVLDSDLRSVGARFFLVKDPSGYLIEIAE